MLTDVTLVLASHDILNKISLTISDRNGPVEQSDLFKSQFNLKFTFPNTLSIKLLFDPAGAPGSVYLESLVIGGLALPTGILDQICQFTPKNSNQSIITRHWHDSGNIAIDFFSADWVQYHLLYGNKIQLKNI
jgi:hypothetical protein